MAIKFTVDAKHLQQDPDKLPYGKGNGKWPFIQKNVTSYLSLKINPIKYNYTLHDHPLESLEEEKHLSLSNNQKRIKMEKLCTGK